MESETEYWRRNRETFLAKEGLPHVVTLSSILREEGTRYEGVVEELVGITIRRSSNTVPRRFRRSGASSAPVARPTSPAGRTT